MAGTEDQNRSLILGNGFSIKYFSYKTLFAAAKLSTDDPISRLFGQLKTVDFEKVVLALEEAAIVEEAYGNVDHAKQLVDDGMSVRRKLVELVRVTHPGHREDIADTIPHCVDFLLPFQKIFTFNYDLLLYWVCLERPKHFKDGFGLGKESNGFLGPFQSAAHCSIYNLHGGLHLFEQSDGNVAKRIAPHGIIDAIAQSIVDEKMFPIYVAEGSSQAKMKKINSNAYLRHCYDVVSKIDGVAVIYGHSAARNDTHIYRALFSNPKLQHIYFCVHKPTAAIDEIDGELARYKTMFGRKLGYTFVDSETCRIWN
ncbi:DUF4917 family protein [Roseiarcaceae bacterium H3SJ34-1]|uniref:DUF4917 family protein n=1 Tax=Terripilifer ovatus TaxID=3032367 RepID=UPI003AB974D1|nr:DUF4917 family protein [Roseiarcaceae bacterium H3SJ34-1]